MSTKRNNPETIAIHGGDYRSDTATNAVASNTTGNKNKIEKPEQFQFIKLNTELVSTDQHDFFGSLWYYKRSSTCSRTILQAHTKWTY